MSLGTTLTPEEFVDIVKRHGRFVRGMVGGRRADLRFQNLSNLRLPKINFQNATLAGFSRQLTASPSLEEIRHAICAEIARLFDVRTVLMIPSDEGPQLRAAYS